MNKLRFVLPMVFAFVIILGSILPVFAANLIQNPGFEDGENPWEFIDVAMRTDEASHSGDWAGLVIDTEEWFAGRISQEIEPQCAEYLEFWYTSTILGDPIYFEVRIDYDDSEQKVQLPYGTTQGWTRYVLNLDSSKRVQRIGVAVASDNLAYVAVDDFYLAPCARAVGGIYAPTDRLSILTPFIALVGLIGAISSIFVIRRWYKD